MPRYFFHLVNDIETQDEDGRELTDAAAALEQARGEALAMAAVSVARHGHLLLNHRIVVTDEQGREIGIVRFGDVVSVGNDEPN